MSELVKNKTLFFTYSQILLDRKFKDTQHYIKTMDSPRWKGVCKVSQSALL